MIKCDPPVSVMSYTVAHPPLDYITKHVKCLQYTGVMFTVRQCPSFKETASGWAGLASVHGYVVIHCLKSK